MMNFNKATEATKKMENNSAEESMDEELFMDEFERNSELNERFDRVKDQVYKILYSLLYISEELYLETALLRNNVNKLEIDFYQELAACNHLVEAKSDKDVKNCFEFLRTTNDNLTSHIESTIKKLGDIKALEKPS